MLLPHFEFRFCLLMSSARPRWLTGDRAGLEARVLTLITLPIAAIVFTRFYHQNRCQISKPRPFGGCANVLAYHTILTPWRWFDRSKSQLVGFSLIAGILEASKCKY